MYPFPLAAMEVTRHRGTWMRGVRNLLGATALAGAAAAGAAAAAAADVATVHGVVVFSAGDGSGLSLPDVFGIHSHDDQSSRLKCIFQSFERAPTTLAMSSCPFLWRTRSDEPMARDERQAAAASAEAAITAPGLDDRTFKTSGRLHKTNNRGRGLTAACMLQSRLHYRRHKNNGCLFFCR